MFDRGNIEGTKPDLQKADPALAAHLRDSPYDTDMGNQIIERTTGIHRPTGVTCVLTSSLRSTAEGEGTVSALKAASSQRKSDFASSLHTGAIRGLEWISANDSGNWVWIRDCHRLTSRASEVCLIVMSHESKTGTVSRRFRRWRNGLRP